MQSFLLLASKDLVSIVTQPIASKKKTSPLQYRALNVKSRTKSGQVEILFYQIARIKTSAQQIVN